MPRSTPSRLLKAAIPFSALSEPELAQVAGMAVERSLAPGEYVFLEGDEPRWLYLVVEGRVKVAKTASSGKEFIVAFFGPGEMFGEAAVFENRSYPASAQAVVPTVVLAIKRSEFIAFLTANPQVSLRIIALLSARLREAHSRLKDLAVERVEQRLARTLLLLSSRLGPTLPFTRQELADMAGTTTETAIRITTRLRDRGIIRSTRGGITIIDEESLRLLAEGSPDM